MTQRVYVPADARARSQMLAAHLKESARKLNGDATSDETGPQGKASSSSNPPSK